MIKFTQLSLSWLMLGTALVATRTPAATTDEEKAAIELLKNGDAANAGVSFTQSLVTKAREVQTLTRQLQVLKDPRKEFGPNQYWGIQQTEAQLAEAENSLAEALKATKTHLRGGILTPSEVRSAVDDINAVAATKVHLLQSQLNKLESMHAAVSQNEQYAHLTEIADEINATKVELKNAERMSAEKFATFAEFTGLTKSDLEKVRGLAKVKGELNGRQILVLSTTDLATLRKGGTEASFLQKKLLRKFGKNAAVLGGLFVAGTVVVTLYEHYGYFQDYNQVDGRAQLLASGDMALNYAKPESEAAAADAGDSKLDKFIQ